MHTDLRWWRRLEGNGRRISITLPESMETILNKIEDQLAVLDKQLESVGGIGRWVWHEGPLTEISKKVHVRVSLLACILLLSSCILCFVLFGPSLLSYLKQWYSGYWIGTCCVRSTQCSTRWVFFGITRKRSTWNGITDSFLLWVVLFTGFCLECCTLLTLPSPPFPASIPVLFIPIVVCRSSTRSKCLCSLPLFPRTSTWLLLPFLIFSCARLCTRASLWSTWATLPLWSRRERSRWKRSRTLTWTTLWLRRTNYCIMRIVATNMDNHCLLRSHSGRVYCRRYS